MTAVAGMPIDQAKAPNQWLVIGASSLGTVFEWYDFYLYGLLATVISAQFFSGVNEVTGFIFALAAFAAGFAVRPFGALVFGRLGDLVGRKHTFLITMSIMGGATFLVGLLPSYAKAGVIAPILLVLLRLLQGLALGGEYGGAATYVAEFARPVYQLDSDHCHLGAVRRPARGHRHAHRDRRGCLQSLGLAHSVLGLAAAVDRLAVDSHAAGGEPGIHGHEEVGHHLKGTAGGGIRTLDQFEGGADCTVWRGRG
jgi:MFS family permease